MMTKGDALGPGPRRPSRAGAFGVGDRDAPALALYKRLGFVSVGERAGYYRRNGGRETAIVMRKALA